MRQHADRGEVVLRRLGAELLHVERGGVRPQKGVVDGLCQFFDAHEADDLSVMEA